MNDLKRMNRKEKKTKDSSMGIIPIKARLLTSPFQPIKRTTALKSTTPNQSDSQVLRQR
jgi:hypothetical protein